MSMRSTEAAPIEEAGSVGGDQPFVSIVVPAYNEELVLEQTLNTLIAHLDADHKPFDWEIVVVDDGSSDATPDIADAFAATHRRVRVLHHRINFNLGQALRYAFGTCTGDYVVTIDCDLSYSPDHIDRIVETLQTTGAKIVVASPYAEGGEVNNVPAFRKLISRSANRFLSAAVKGDLSTLTSMVRGYDRRFLRTLNLKAMDIEINTEILYKARILRARIVEIPARLEWELRKEGAERQRVSSLRVGRSTAAYVFTGFLFRPVPLFVLPGVALLSVAMALTVYVLVHLFLVGGHELNDHIGVLVITGSAYVIGVQLVMLGLLAVQAKRYYEELFHLGTSILRRAGGVGWPLEPPSSPRR